MKLNDFRKFYPDLDFGILITITKKFILIGLVLFSIILFPLNSYGTPLEQIPNPRLNNSWVADTAHILSESTQATINQKIDQLEAKNGTEIAVVTVENTASFASPKQFTTGLFNHWGIGKQGQDNGVLFVVSVGERRVEIETGYGVEGILPDARVGRIIDNQIIPQFKQGNFDQGVLNGTIALVQALENESFLPIDNFNLPSPLAINTILIGLFSFIGYQVYQKNKGKSQESTAQIGIGGITLLSIINNFSIVATVFIIIYALIAYIFYQKAKADSQMFIPINPVGYFRCKSKADDCDKELYSYIYWAAFWMANAGGIIIANFMGYFQYINIFDIITVIIFSSLFSLVFAFSIAALLKKSFNQNKQGMALHKFGCNICHEEMEMIPTEDLKYLLKKPQQVAMELGSIAVEGWHCPQCYPNINLENLHLRSYTLNHKYQPCSHCQELTKKTESQVIVPATYDSTGTMRITKTCQCCGDAEEYTQIIPKKVRSSSSSYSGGSYSGGSSSSGGGDSFGGGSSGGGGAGGNW